MVESGGGRERFSPGLPLGLAVVAVWLTWSWFDGGFEPSLWGPLGACLVLLLVVAPRALRGPQRQPLALLAAGTVVLFAGWNFLSILWAQFPAEAWTGADKTAAYAAGFLVLLLSPLRRSELAVLLGVYTAGVVVIAATVLARTALADDPGRWFADSRLVPPTGYTNSSVALWTLALWPALYLGSTRAAPAVVRPFFLAGAALLVEVAVLGESRAWIVVLPIAAVVFLLTARDRIRSLVGVVVVAAATLAVLRPLLDVYERGSQGGRLDPPVDHAARAILLSCLGAAVVGGIWAALDVGIRLPRRILTAAAVLVVCASLTGAALGATWAAARIDHPGRWISARWHDFTCQTCGTATGTSRFGGSLSDNRYREWIVAWKTFLRHPVAGAGSDNYEAQYLLLRRDALIEPRYPHSTPLRLLAELGAVGTALFVLAVGAAFALALRARRVLDHGAAGAVGAALSMFSYWLLHGSLDWFWEIPALAGPAIGMLGLAARPAVFAHSTPMRSRGPRPVPLAAIGAGAAVAAAGALVLPWLAYRYEQSGVSVWRHDPDLAYRRLERAADLNPLSARPLVVEGSIALRRGDEQRAREALRHAIDREPGNWYAWLQLGLLDGSAAHFDAAAAEIRRARELNPKDPVVALTERLLRRRITVDPREVSELYGSQERRRFGT
jgi:tetratricopeptide (TPR) repeat protein